MATYLKKWEKFVPPMDGHSLSGQYTPGAILMSYVQRISSRSFGIQTEAHGLSGPIQATINNFVYPGVLGKPPSLTCSNKRLQNHSGQ